VVHENAVKQEKRETASLRSKRFRWVFFKPAESPTETLATQSHATDSESYNIISRHLRLI